MSRAQVARSEDHRRNLKLVGIEPGVARSRHAARFGGMTGGRGAFSMSMDHYEEVPAHLQEKIIAAHKAAKEEE